MKIVSGMRPTGRLHLGNYFGALKNWVELQEKYNCSFFVADWHALTTGYEDTSKVIENGRLIVAGWLAGGLDPKKCVIFRQSDITEHAEFHLLLSMITPVGWLLKCPTYREQLIALYKDRYAGQEDKTSAKTAGAMRALAGTADIKDEKEIAALSEISSYGFLGYPVLMTSDIVIHNGNAVPVGEDQVAHIEITRDIVRRFNRLYGKDILTEPKPLLTKTARIPGLDGRKMSKSYGNYIELGENPESVQPKIMRMFTDPNKKRADDKGNPDGCVVFAFHKLYDKDLTARECACREGKLGCVVCKKDLFKLMEPSLAEQSEKMKKYENTSLVEDILKEGAVKACETARETLDRVRLAMKLK